MADRPKTSGPPGLLGGFQHPPLQHELHISPIQVEWPVKAVLFLPKSSRSADVQVSLHVLSHLSPKMMAL